MYDLAVIGAGPGGYVSAIKASQLGLNTILFEEEKPGGVCLNKGCIPTKAMLKSAEVFNTVKTASEYGIRASQPILDFNAVMSRKNGIVADLVSGIGSLLKRNGVTTVTAHANVVSPYCMVANGEQYQAKNIILATGSKPVRVTIKGNYDRLMISDDIFNLEKLPSSIAIIGGGIIGLEFAVMLNAFGVKTTIVELLPSIITMADEAVIEAAHTMLVSSGITVYENSKVTEVTARGLICEKGGKQFELDAEKILLCIGRVPNTDIQMLDDLGIRHERGKILVDTQLRTNISNIFAVGDVNGKKMLAHAASAQGITAAEIIAGVKKNIEFTATPSCIFTVPEIAWVGLTEKEAKQQYGSVKTSVFPMTANGKSKISGKTEGFIKLITDTKYNLLVGAHLCCDRASDMIAGMTLALNMECSAAEIARTIHPHPTVSEACMEAAEGVFGSSIHYHVKSKGE